MNRTTLLFRILTFVLTLVAFGCRREPRLGSEYECPCDTSIAGMKEWYFFKTGTWWVYRERNGGMLDTVTVYEHSEGISSGGFDAFSYRESHSYDHYDIQYWYNSSFDASNGVDPNCISRRLAKSRYRPGDYVGECKPFLYPIYDGNFVEISGYSNDGPHTGLSSLSFPFLLNIENGNDLDSLMKWKLDADLSMGGQPTTFMIQKNKGIIQAEYPDSNQVWELVSSHIIQ